MRTELELAGRPGRSRDELCEAVANSTSEVDRLVSLADDLLLLARTDEGIPLQRWPGQAVEPVLRAAARAFGIADGARGVRIEVEAAGGLVADIDAGRVRQAIDNLVSNALRHAPAGSEVRLTAQEEDGQLVIAAADRGPGFPPEFLPHAFERFRRVDSGRGRDQGGSGLGLAVVRAIARAHGGEADARNQDGGGAMVRIVIPDALRHC